MATKTNYFWTHQLDDGTSQVGLNDEGRQQLGMVLFIDLPAVGTVLTENGKFVSVEAEKTVTNLDSPLAGTVIAVNEKLGNNPAALNSNSAEDNWIVILK